MYNALPPPPPPQGYHNPLEVPVEWYVDIPTSLLGGVFGNIPVIQEKTLCSISLVAGGDHVSSWARFVVFGKPIGIHNALLELKRIAPVVEVGYSAETPFPLNRQSPVDDLEDVMPIYHAAWTEFNIKRR